MRSRSPATSARACWASCAYCSGLLPLRLSVVNMSCSLAAAAAAPGLCGGKGGAMNATGEAQAPRMADGFVHRGRQVTRLETFVDAAFAFAVTLLVISIDEIPDSRAALVLRSEEHTSELQSLMRISYSVFCLKKKNQQ